MMEDELDSLRERTARTHDVYEEMDYDAPAGGFSGFLSRLTPVQRLILAVLLLLDVLAVAFGLLLITGTVTL